MSKIRLFDIAANLCDQQFFGVYHNKKYHSPDHREVLLRGRANGVQGMILTSGNLDDF